VGPPLSPASEKGDEVPDASLLEKHRKKKEEEERVPRRVFREKKEKRGERKSPRVSAEFAVRLGKRKKEEKRGKERHSFGVPKEKGKKGTDSPVNSHVPLGKGEKGEHEWPEVSEKPRLDREEEKGEKKGGVRTHSRSNLVFGGLFRDPAKKKKEKRPAWLQIICLSSVFTLL